MRNHANLACTTAETISYHLSSCPCSRHESRHDEKTSEDQKSALRVPYRSRGLAETQNSRFGAPEIFRKPRFPQNFHAAQACKREGLARRVRPWRDLGSRTLSSSPGAQLLLQDELVLRPQASPDPVQVRRVILVRGDAVFHLTPQPVVQDQRRRAHQARNGDSFAVEVAVARTQHTTRRARRMRVGRGEDS